MKIYLSITFAIAVLSHINSQNLIVNPGFEIGSVVTGADQVSNATSWARGCARVYCSTCNTTGFTKVGSPDLFDANSTDSDHDVPLNKWAANRPAHTGGRYVGFAGTSVSNPLNATLYGESVLGSLSQVLNRYECAYNFEFWASAIDGTCMAGSTPGTPNACTPTIKPVNIDTKIQVVLRKNGDCSLEKIVYTSPTISNKFWTNYSGSFTLTQTEAALGFNKIEYRLTRNTNPTPANTHTVFLDDVSLEYPTIVPVPNFIVPRNHCVGQPVIVDGTSTINESSYSWCITQCDAQGNNAWNPNTTWCTNFTNGEVGFFDISQNLNNNLIAGNYYLIRLSVLNCGGSEQQDFEIIYISPLPNADAGPDKIICQNSTINIGHQSLLNNSYYWTGNGIVGVNNTANIIVQPVSTSIYTLTVTNEFGCIATDNIEVKVDVPFKTPIITKTGGGLICPEPFNLLASSISGVSYTWNPGSLGGNPVVVSPSTNTIYTLTTSNACAVKTSTVQVIPNAGISGDFFAPLSSTSYMCNSLPFMITNMNLPQASYNGYNATEYILDIYNRWGEKIYSYQSPYHVIQNDEIRWNGIANISTNYSLWEIVFGGKFNTTAGDFVMSGNYAYKLYLKNCTHSSFWEVSVGTFIVTDCMPLINSGDNLRRQKNFDIMENKNNEFSIYPNPTKEFVYMNIPSNKKAHRLEVISYEGKNIKEIIIKDENNSSIDLHGIAQGIYIFKIIYLDGSSENKKIVILE